MSAPIPFPAQTPAPAETQNLAAQYVPTFREKLGWRIFPQGCPKPTEAKFTVRDFIRIDADVHLSFLDRLRMLATGHIRVKLAIEVDAKLGAVNVNSHSNVQPPKWLQR